MSEILGSSSSHIILEDTSKMDDVSIPIEEAPISDSTSDVQYYLVPASTGWVLLPAASIPDNISDLPAYTNESGIPLELNLNNEMIIVNSDINNDSTLIHIPESTDLDENNTLISQVESVDNKSENESENQIRIYNSNNILNSALISSNISFESSPDRDDNNETEVQLNLISDNQMLLLNSNVLNCDLEMPLKYSPSDLSSVNDDSTKIHLDLVSGNQIFVLKSDDQLKGKSDLNVNNEKANNSYKNDIPSTTNETHQDESGNIIKQKQLKKKRQTFKLNNSNNPMNENTVTIPNYCEYCSQKFPTSASLRSHSKYIHTLNLVCKYCKLNHTELQDLLKHYTEIHKTITYECNECESNFINESDFGKHLQDHVKDTPFPCKSNNCIERFKTLSDLKEHIKSHLLIACIKCGEKYKKEDMVNAHGNYCNSCIQVPRIVNVIDRHFINPIPLQPFVDDEDLSLKLPTKTYKLYSCNYCNKKFNSEHLLDKHLINQHEPNDKYICSKCGEKLRNNSELEIHFKGHIDKIIPTSYPCNLCNKEFINKRTLKQHLQTIHSKIRPFVCNVCDKSFQRRCIYNVHMLRHSKTSPYKCDYCKKAYKIKFELKEHIQKKHIIKQSYPCIKCNGIFKTSNDLYNHYKIHKDSKLFSCNLCKKSFKYKQGLKLHLVVHSNVRPFNCNYCIKSFQRKAYLRTHIASCHKIEYKFACNKCDMKFKTASSRYVHSKIHKELTN